MHRVLQNIRDRYGSSPSQRWTSIVLVTLWALLLIFLIEADAPWEGEAAKWQAHGRAWRVSDYVQVYLWWISAFHFVLLSVLLGVLPWWWGLTHCDEKPLITPRSRWTRVQLILVLGGLLVAFFLRWPWMDRYLLLDEQDTLRRNTFGYHLEQPDGSERFHSLSWQETIWENRIGNNPVLFSALSRLSLRSWQWLSGAGEEVFSVGAIRFPSLVAGMLSLWVLAWVGMRWGIARGGLLALWFGALHPLHIEYSVQARGYGLVLLLTPLMAYAASEALRSGRWRHWVGLGVSEVAILLSFPGTIYWVVALNVAVLVVLAFAKGNCSPRRALAARWMVVSVFAGMLFLWIIAPSLPQIRAHLERTPNYGALDFEWFYYSYLQFAAGKIFFVDPSMQTFADFWPYLRDQFMPEHPWLSFYLAILFPAALFCGWWRSLRVGFPHPWISVAAAMSPLLAIAHHRFFTGLFLFYWYLIFILPFVLLWVGQGVDLFLRRASEKLPGKSLWWSLGASAFLLYFALLGGHQKYPPVVPVRKEPFVYQRGRSDFIIYPQGKMVLKKNVRPKK